MLEDLDRLMDDEGIDAFLASGDAFNTPDIYWLTGFRSPDSIILFKNRGESSVVATGFHTLNRLLKESFIKETYNLDEIYLNLMRKGKRSIDNPELIYGPVLKDLFTGKVLGVPDHLPARVLLTVQKLGYKVKAVPKLLTNARATKSPKEIKIIKKAGDATIGAMSQIVEMVKNSDIGPNKVLLLNGEPLTVARVKNALDHFLVDKNAESAEDAIVAVGKKAFDWHYLGAPKDKFKAETPIIMDVFPRLKIDRYVADVTRTFVKGSVPKEVRKMFEAVDAAAKATTDTLRAGALIDEDVNMACYQTLKKHGFDSSRLNPEAKDGMTHGLGHGIGLEVHELPSMYNRTASYEVGHVVAVEPGVYLKRFGGVRIENDYAVQKGKAKFLTSGLDNVLFL